MKKFYRSKLSTLVWDSKNNKILADFRKGYFITDDERTIKILTKLGYPEVDFDSEKPPEGVEVSPPALELVNGKAPIFSDKLPPKLAEKRLDRLTKPSNQTFAEKVSEKIKIPKIKKTQPKKAKK